MKLVRSLVFCALTLVSACASYDTPGAMAGDGLTGALVGGGIGAGTGAIIGASMSGGDVAASALLGGAIGAGVGIAATVGYRSARTGMIIRRNRSQINSNARQLARNQTEIDALRLEADTVDIQLDESRFDEVYDGPILGQENR